VVGEAEVAPGDSHAFLWEDGVMHDLAAAGPFNRAFGINDRGDVVGHFQLRPLLWRDGVLTELTGLISAFDVNDRLEVAGALVLDDGISTFHPAIWRDGAVIDLGVPEGGYLGVARAINRRGDAVGHVDGRAFRWENGTRVALPSLLPSGGAFALDVDESGLLIAGESMSNPNAVGGAPHGVVWVAGRPTDLGTLPGGTVSTAWAIADKGRFLAGVSTESGTSPGRAVIWTSR
jgi:probable HAF family extracellular repeat protein